MKILIIVSSKHRQNTLKVAEAMSEAAFATVVELDNIANYKIENYDVIGFGSGIYAGKFDKKMIRYIKSLTNESHCTFVFSTSGTGNYLKYNEETVKLLESKNKTVLGNWGCKGLCKWFIFGLIGGIAKGHPDINDFEEAQQFIESVSEKYSELKTQ